MSILSAQIEKLRKAAQTYRTLGNHELEQLLLDAADTISELRDTVRWAQRGRNFRHIVFDVDDSAWATEAENAKLETENAKLRKQMRGMWLLIWHMTHGATYVPIEDGKAVREENKRLRELVRFIMHQCNDGNPRCDECISWNDGECVALLRMRELGVEVEG